MGVAELDGSATHGNAPTAVRSLLMTDPHPADPTAPVVCVDVGSCWTKAVLVHPDGSLAGFAEHPTTVEDVLAGVDAAVGKSVV